MENGEFLDFKISREVVREWLKTVYRLTGMDDLDTALAFAYHVVSDEDDKRAVYTIAEIIRREASGEVRPPLDIYKMYREVVNS